MQPVTFMRLLNPNFMEKKQKSSEQILRKQCYRWTDRQMDRQLDRAEFIGSFGKAADPKNSHSSMHSSI